MVHIRIKKGLDIPMEGAPKNEVTPLRSQGSVVWPKEVALDLSPFHLLRFRLLVRPGDQVKAGQPIAADKRHLERVFVSPAGGVVKEVRRGLKRRLMSVVITLSDEESFVEFERVDPKNAPRDQLIKLLLDGGIFPRIRQRPLDQLAEPQKVPRAIFVKAIESAPFVPSAEMQVAELAHEFQAGLDCLTRLTDGKVHLVYREGSPMKAFTEARHVEKHTIEGPHPSGNASVHIHHISPIERIDEVVWTIDAWTTAAIGHILMHGKILTDRVVGVAGSGVVEGRTGFFKVRDGFPVSALIEGRLPKEDVRLISGDPLTGQKVDATGFIGYYDSTLSVIPENHDRQFMHFFRLGSDKYTASRTYLSGFFKNRLYSFDTNKHGEERFFVIGSPYDKVMPMNINTMQLVKAVLAEDFDLAEVLGFLEVAPEDFALATFVDPSKIEMTQIIREKLDAHALEVLH